MSRDSVGDRKGEVRISELADVAGVPVATVKYYLREGLLAPGHVTAPNQASYDEAHVERLRLVRVLREVGGLRIDAIRRLVAVIDDQERSLHEVLGAAHRALSPAASSENGPGAGPNAEVQELLERLGWDVSKDAPDRDELAQALVALRGLGLDLTADVFLPYARAVEPVAARELQGLPTEASRDEAVRYVVVGTVVFGAAMNALRRLAQEHYSALRTAGH